MTINECKRLSAAPWRRRTVPLASCREEPVFDAMIEAAGLGVAVANATDEARASADYVCRADNRGGAVAEALERFVLVK